MNRDLKKKRGMPMRILPVGLLLLFLTPSIIVNGQDLDRDIENAKRTHTSLVKKRDSLKTRQSTINQKSYKERLAAASICKQADSLLRVPYSEQDVKRYLSQCKSHHNPELDSLSARLSRYGVATRQLETTLSDVIKKMGDVSESTFKNSPESMQKMLIDDWTSELATLMRSGSITPQTFPYLYGVMSDAIDALLEGSREGVQLCINALRKKK